MAGASNPSYRQFLYSNVPMLTMIDGHIVIGAAGAVSSFTGKGIYNVALLAAGIYSVQLTNNFKSFVGHDFSLQSPVTGANVADGSFVVGTMYQITAVGTTGWSAVGLNTGLTPAIGQQFVATAVGGVGTGTAKVVGSTGVASIELGEPAAMLQVNNLGQGAIFMARMLDFAGALVAPASGTIIDLSIYLKNSSVSV